MGDYEGFINLLAVFATGIGVGGIAQALTGNWLAALSAAWTGFWVAAIYMHTHPR